MSERNGPGGMNTESRSPMITSGVAAPSVASNNIAVVITTAATDPASRPAEMAFVLLIGATMSCRGVCRDERLCFVVKGLDANAATTILLWCRKNLAPSFHNHLGRHLLHAGMIERALAQAAVIARRTGQEIG